MDKPKYDDNKPPIKTNIVSSEKHDYEEKKWYLMD